ncbi:leucine-rich repeat domain-containing protein [Prosthecobacter dejongeii]|uniref:Leucine Rich repeats (2 copies) n=1 Tax=Prosthecobacter dejongeii TaxID=48465 RepID=A0A7W7YIA1_9BACT|nr:G protein-coupled receptor LGR4 [Prosthecobacter dejongeii]MBB5036728.1 hypothetical protein [Prosthecobacter dejongeii]
MKRSLSFFSLLAFATCAFTAGPDLSRLSSQTEMDEVIATTSDAALKQALQEHSKAILIAAAEHPHAEAIARTVEGAKGKIERINTTPESLQKAMGAPSPIFTTLKLVDLAIPNAGPHDHRKEDPYDAAFFAHLGHLSALESLNIIATKLGDDWITPIGQLTTLKSLRFTNNGSLTDAGMEQLAGLKNLESFSFVGTKITGRAYAKFEGFTKLIKVSHRGSSINDEGLKQLCDHLPNLESLSLAHAKFTDAGAVHLKKLTKLKGLEMGTPNATPASLKNLETLPLEYLQLGDGLDRPEGITAVRNIPSLRRLTLTRCDKLDDAGLKLATQLTQLHQLEIGGLDLPDDRLPQLQAFAFLQELKLIRRPQGYPAETQAKIKALLPNVDVKFQ